MTNKISDSYQQFIATAEADARARHSLQVDVRAQGLHVPEAALQRALLREPRLQPEDTRREGNNL